MTMDPDKFETLVKDVAEIKTALIGQPQFEQEGIIAKVKRHEKHYNNSKKRAGFIMGLSAAGGWLLHKITELFN